MSPSSRCHLADSKGSPVKWLQCCLLVQWLTVLCGTAAFLVHILCTPYNQAPVYTTVSFYSKPHMNGACVFSCSLPPALLAEWLGYFTCYCRNMGVEWILKSESAQKADPGEENSPATPAGSWTLDLLITGCPHWYLSMYLSIYLSILYNFICLQEK